MSEIQICTIFATEIFFLIAGEILLPHTSSVPTLTRIWKYSGLKDFNAQNSEGEKLYDINTEILILQHRHQMTPELIWRWNLRPLVSNLEKTTNYHHHHHLTALQRPATHNSWLYKPLKLSILPFIPFGGYTYTLQRVLCRCRTFLLRRQRQVSNLEMIWYF